MDTQAGATGAIRVGTRGSALAMTQTTTVAERVADLAALPYELVRIRTEGDVLRGSLSQIGGTGVFVAALRDALLEERCDIAVHSLKDLPTLPAPGLTVASVPEREDVRDALCARDGLTLATLPDGARVGTGSPRRAAQLRAARPGLDVVDIRGNVDTRLGRVAGLVIGAPGDLDAVVLAAAGLKRLGRDDAITELIDPAVMLPAPGQGALAVECREAEATAGMREALAAYDHLPTRLAVTAERAVLLQLEAGCAAPIGALARLQGEELALEAVVCSLDGRAILRVTRSAPATDAVAAARLGVELAEELLAAGAADIAPLSS
ncbi:hydroxymethylbilane synthase [Arthrobacter sp. N1]|uniref:hydroxymethylbilane synthase n=1 Tax=Arthrobacter sp. N1 TaxID=619291 RepID=UPI003BAEA490